MLTRVIQPSLASCGQACLAMITGKPIEEIFKLLPDKLSGTSILQLRRALKLLGYKTDSQLRRIYTGQLNHLDPLPDLAILRIIWPGSGRKLGHWCVWDGESGTMLDPSPDLLYGNYKISSFLEVRKCPERNHSAPALAMSG